MIESVVPEDVQTFLRDHVESHEQLQIVRWLEERREMAHSADQVSAALGIPALVAGEALRSLHRQHILSMVSGEGPPQFRFAPAAAHLSVHVERLLAYAAEDPVAIMKLMTANAIDRLRRGASSFFSEEFAKRR